MQVEENGKSKCRLVMRRIEVICLNSKECRLPLGFLITRELVEFLKGESK
ncbi:hypothetical protein [Leptotrichia shahii]|jgi:hypothetical protein|nr:hypothetical protein [Leptotrichia shahii]